MHYRRNPTRLRRLLSAATINACFTPHGIHHVQGANRRPETPRSTKVSPTPPQGSARQCNRYKLCGSAQMLQHTIAHRVYASATMARACEAHRPLDVHAIRVPVLLAMLRERLQLFPRVPRVQLRRDHGKGKPESGKTRCTPKGHGGNADGRSPRHVPCRRSNAVTQHICISIDLCY